MKEYAVGWALDGEDLTYLVVEADYIEVYPQAEESSATFWVHESVGSQSCIPVLVGSARGYCVLHEKAKVAVDFVDRT